MTTLTRREFIATCLRYTVAGGIAAVGAVLGTRALRDPTCRRFSPCQACPEQLACNRPEKDTNRRAAP